MIGDAIRGIGGLAKGVEDNARSVAAIARSGLLSPERPDTLFKLGREVAGRGPIGAVITMSAIRWGDAPALTDDRGTLSFRDLDQRSNAIARALSYDGVRAGDSIAILCRNHRGFIDATFASTKLGLRCVLMNTEFAGPQLRDVCEHEGIRVMICDSEYDDRVPESIELHYCAFSEDGSAGKAKATLEDLIAQTSAEPVPASAEHAKIVLLTSGTTGTPKGAPRDEAGTLTTAGALFDRIPIKTGETTYIAPPFFHALGFATLNLAMVLGSHVVTARRFDAAGLLDRLAASRASMVVVVPAMLQRVFDLGDDEVRLRNLSALRIVFSSGSQLPGPTAQKVLEHWGDVLYVLYGSTEVAFATLSTPKDHRASPVTVGKPCLGSTVKLLDEAGDEVEPGEPGRIFVSNGVEFSGYTDGRTKEVIRGLMSSGDVGHFDSDGRLYIDGRDDDMIVSGGENVFPQEIEDLLLSDPSLVDCALVGVADEKFGQRLSAFVVPAEGAEIDEESLKTLVKDNLARFKVPREFRVIDEIPRNATGKILRRVLAEWAEQPAGT